MRAMKDFKIVRPSSWSQDKPQGWGEFRVDSIFSNSLKKNSSQGLEAYLSLMANVGVIPFAEKGNVGNKPPEDFSNCKVAKRGDFVLNSMNFGIGSFGIAPQDGILSPVYFVLRKINPDLDADFLRFVFSSAAFREYVQMLGSGILEHRAAIPWEKFKSVRIPAPEIQEQKRRAEYLDQETSQIDLLISKKEQLIEKLLERRQALITHAVTKGLDPNVPMKDSGDEWIGDIPRHWSASQLGRVLQSSVVDGPHETPVFLEEGHPFLSVDSIVDGELEELQTRLISEADFNSFRRKARPERDDILMGKAASIGKIARVKTDWEFAIWSPLALLKISKSEGNPGFIEFSLKSSFLQAQIEVLSSSNTQKNLSMGKIPSLKIALPPLAEQAAIAEYLAIETEQIGALISQIRKALSLLKERRQALITQVVTGKLDVRGFAGGNA